MKNFYNMVQQHDSRTVRARGTEYLGSRRKCQQFFSFLNKKLFSKYQISFPDFPRKAMADIFRYAVHFYFLGIERFKNTGSLNRNRELLHHTPAGETQSGLI
jgi:hypothetical protein